MRTISKVIDSELNLHEMKACFDIALIKLHTYLDTNNKLCRKNNIFCFIYGTSSNMNNDTRNDLNYRYRGVSALNSVFDAHKDDVDFNMIDVVALDIMDAYAGYCVVNHKSNNTVQYGNLTITTEVMADALLKLKQEVIKVILKLLHGETIYTLLLDTPIGRDGVYNQSAGKFYGDRRDDVSDMNYSSFRDYLIVHNPKIRELPVIVDIQGLVFHCLKQYFADVMRTPDIQQRYALYSARDVETRKGLMDKSSRDLLEMRDTHLPDYSLTRLFEMLRKLDGIFFHKRNCGVVYSILEWFAEYTSSDILKHINTVQQNRTHNAHEIAYGANADKPAFSRYQETFEYRVLLRKYDGGAEDEFMEKIMSTRKVLTLLYEEWYLQKDAKISTEKINKLCALCERLYFHNYKDYRTGKMYGSTKKIKNGVLEVTIESDKRPTHYINLVEYRQLMNNGGVTRLKEYTCVPKDRVELYLDTLIQTNINDNQSMFDYSGIREQGNALEYILLPEGVTRIKDILKLFQELDIVASKLEQCNASLYEILPAYYSETPATIRGALQYALQEKRIASFTPSSNALFDDKIFNDTRVRREDTVVFDWSIPRTTELTDSSNKPVQSLADVTKTWLGLSNAHYLKYYESVLYNIFLMAFPNSLREGESHKYYEFRNTVAEIPPDKFGTSTSCINGKQLTDYDLMAKELHIDFYEPKEKASSNFMHDTDMRVAMDTADAIAWASMLIGGSVEDVTMAVSKPEIEPYRVDLRREFYASCTVNTLYTIFCLFSLLYKEYLKYTSKNYYCQYAGYYDDKTIWGTKIPWDNIKSTAVGDMGPYLCNTIKNIKEVHDVVTNKHTGLATEEKYLPYLELLTSHLDKDVTVSIPALAELSPDMIQRRLLSKRWHKPDISNGLCFVAVASTDMIIFNGRRYDIACYTNSQGYVTTLVALPTDVEDSDIPNIKCASVDITQYHRDGILSTNVFGITICDSYKALCKATKNNRLFYYLTAVWDEIVADLVCEIVQIEYASEISRILGYQNKEVIRSNLRVFTATDAWMIFKSLFANDPVKGINDAQLHSVIQSEVPLATDTDVTYRPITNYYWRLDEQGVPIILKHLTSWNSASLIIRSLADVHQLSHALNTLAKDKILKNYKEYTEFVSGLFVDLLWEHRAGEDTRNATAVARLSANAFLQAGNSDQDSTEETTSLWKYNSYRPIYWIDKDVPTAIHKSLTSGQAQYITDMLTNASNPVIGTTPKNVKWNINDNLKELLSRIAQIQDNEVFPVKGVTNTIDHEQDMEAIKIYGMYRNDIAEYVRVHRDAFKAINIGALGITSRSKSLQSERFYQTNHWFMDAETEIMLKNKSPMIPYSTKDRSRNKFCFLHHQGYWICIDQATTEISHIMYEELIMTNGSTYRRR